MPHREGVKPEEARCRQCGRPLTPDEIAVTRKLVNRGATPRDSEADLIVRGNIGEVFGQI